MKTLRERDIAKMEIQERHRNKLIRYYIERRAGRLGEYSLLEQFLEVDKIAEMIGQEQQRGRLG
jgi:hypothetical protein